MIRRLRVVAGALVVVLAAGWLLLAGGDDDALSAEETLSLLTELGQRQTLAYATADGVTVLEFNSGEITLLEQQADALDVYQPFVLVFEGSRTIAIDPSRPQERQVVVTGGRLVQTDRPDVFAFTTVDAASQEVVDVFVGRLDLGFLSLPKPVPAGASILRVKDLGVLIVLPDGAGTVQATELGYVDFTSGSVIAAAPDAWVELECRSTDDCHARYVERGTDESQRLPDQFGSADQTLLMSPDARWVVRTDDDTTWIYDTTTDREVEAAAIAPDHAAWSPDSTYLAWMANNDGDATLHVLFPDGRESLTVDLSVLGASAPTGTALVVF